MEPERASFARHALEHEEQYGRFPKTLIFAVKDLPHTTHSDKLARTLRKLLERQISCREDSSAGAGTSLRSE